MTSWCQCEHKVHPNDEDATPAQRQRNSPHHPYGQVCGEEELVKVKTIYGLYHICLACTQDHPIPPDLRAK
jgi:hypothetical protein